MGLSCKGLVVAVLFALSVWQIGSGAYIMAKAQLAQLLVAHAWKKVQAGEVAAKPWSWADTWPVARLYSPKHDVDLFILEGSSGHTLAFGPGHMVNTPLPGEPGNSVVGVIATPTSVFCKTLSPGIC